MGLIEDNSDSIAHLILDEADLEFSGFTITTANNPSPWKPEQSGNPSGRPGGTHDLVRYVVETTEGGKLLMLWYSSQGFHTQRTGAGRLQAKEGPAGAAI